MKTTLPHGAMHRLICPKNATYIFARTELGAFLVECRQELPLCWSVYILLYVLAPEKMEKKAEPQSSSSLNGPTHGRNEALLCLEHAGSEKIDHPTRICPNFG